MRPALQPARRRDTGRIEPVELSRRERVEQRVEGAKRSPTVAPDQLRVVGLVHVADVLPHAAGAFPVLAGVRRSFRLQRAFERGTPFGDFGLCRLRGAAGHPNHRGNDKRGDLAPVRQRATHR